ncbi:GALA protein, partial [Psilopogon haemacephalus]|nr:GALA protein [Psilopogon haemacephalus]
VSPDAVDNHRSLNEKHGYSGKREAQPQEDPRAGALGRAVAEDSVVRTLMEFLTYLHLK